MKKRMLCILLLLALVLGQIPAAATQSEQPNTPLTGTVTVVNPLYEHALEESDTSMQEDAPSLLQQANAADSDRITYTSMEEAGAFVRSQMANRQQTVTLCYRTVSKDDQKVNIVKGIVEQAVSETDNNNEGDYLRWQYGKYVCNIEGVWASNGDGTRTYTYKFIYTFTYYTTAQQERELNAKITDVLNAMNISQETDYRKACLIYEYITENVAYEYEEETTIKYTAYSALVRGTAVCQGYALLLYRMLREAGLSTRMIAGTATASGENHAWNIVKLGDAYYYLDSTWDAGNSSQRYDYFLRGSNGFLGHEAWEAYASEAFLESYPIAQGSFVPTESDDPALALLGRGACGENITWQLSGDGVLTLRGSGRMPDYAEGNTPWAAMADSITAVDIGCGIASIGANAFYGCAVLHTAVILPDSVKTIGNGAFAGCTSLPSADVMPEVTEIAAYAFEDGMTLRGCAGSTAQMFAEQHGLMFETVKNISDAEITLSKRQYTYTGAACKPGVTAATSDGTAIRSVFTTYADNINAGTALAMVSGTGEYGGKTAVSFTIEKAIPEVIVPQGLAALRGQSLGEVLLSCAFAWQDAEQPVGTEIGKKIFYATYTPADTLNYRIVRNIPVTVTVHDTIWLSCSAVNSYVGAQIQIVAIALPENAPEGTLRWSSDHTDVADVSENGVVTAKRSGTTTIHVRSVNGECASCTVTVVPMPFVDVGTGDWFYDAVAYTCGKGIFAGDSADTFHPQRNMTRAMLVQVLYSLEGYPEGSATVAFSDVSSGDWFADAVSWAVQSGITAGTGNGKFSPNSSITREQVAKMLYNYADLKGYSTASYVSISGFDDDQIVSGWAIHAMQWAVGNGLMSGTGNNLLSPLGYATRAQTAQMMMKFDYHFVYG